MAHEHDDDVFAGNLEVNRVGKTAQQDASIILIPGAVQGGGFAQRAQGGQISAEKLVTQPLTAFLIPFESLDYVIDYLRA